MVLSQQLNTMSTFLTNLVDMVFFPIFLVDLVRMIDWEFVGEDFPDADLVFFVWSHHLNKRQKKLFLDAYGYKKKEKRFDLMMLLHIFGITAWRMERLDLIFKRKIDKRMYASTKEEQYEEIAKDIVQIKRILKRFG